MKKLAIYSMALAAAGLWSCSADDVKNPAQQVGDNTIKLTGSILSTRAISDPQSNALSANVKVGAFATAPDGDLNNEVNNQYSVVDKAFSPVSKDMTAEDCSSVSVYAYSPYQSGWTLGANTFTVSANQSDEAGYLASDLLHAKAENQNPENVVNLGFTHKLAQLVVKFNNTAELDLSAATVSVLNTLPSVTLNTQDGTLGTASGNPTAITGAVNVGQGAVYTVLVPQTVNSGTDFVKVSRNGYLDLVAPLSENVTFEGGKSYTMTVTLSDGGAAIAIGGISLSNWAEGSTFEAEAQEKEPEPWSPSSFTIPSTVKNCTYDAATGKYEWTNTSNNLMTLAEFPNGELAQYSTLEITFSDWNVAETSGYVRLGVYVGTVWTELSKYYNANTTKTVDLTTVLAEKGIEASAVTSIAFGGGQSGVTEGSLTIFPEDVVFTPKKGYVPPTTTPGDGGDSGDSGNTGGNSGNTGDSGNTGGENTEPGSFPNISVETAKAWSNGLSTLTNGLFKWEATSNNGVTLYTIQASDNISTYKTLRFKLSDITEGAFVRLLYSVNGDNTRTTVDSYYTADGKEKVVDITSWGLKEGSTISLAGPNSGVAAGQVTISDVYFSTEAAN